MKTSFFKNSNRFLVIHIPKTGGTTVSSIITDSLGNQNKAISIDKKSPISSFDMALNSNTQFVSGHVPYSFFHEHHFDKKVTILRKPIDIIASVLSFKRKTGYSIELKTHVSMDKKKPIFEIYRLYFSSTFDVERFRIDKSYDSVEMYSNYIDDCSIDEAIRNITTFDHIINFDDFESGLKKLIILEGLFPFASFECKRSYSYSPNFSEAEEWLSEFDELFYEKAIKLCGEKNHQIQSEYDSYREKYLLSNGIFLSPFQSLILDLRYAIGRGWYEPEISDLGNIFRWSSNQQSTIEIPISISGSYHIYINLHTINDINISCTVTSRYDTGNALVTSNTNTQSLVVLSTYVKLTKPDWVCFNLNSDKFGDYSAVKKEDGIDERELGYILGQIDVRRLDK